MSAVIERYQAKLAERGYTADSAQLAAIERLQRLADELQGFDNRPGGLLKRLMSRGKTPPVASGCTVGWGAARAS